MTMTRQTVAEKLAAYLHHETPLAQLAFSALVDPGPLRILKQEVEAWNTWRDRQDPERMSCEMRHPDADLIYADFTEAPQTKHPSAWPRSEV